MSKLVIMSVLFMTIAIPMRHAADANPQLALKRVVKEFCWFNLFYIVALVYLVPRLG